MKVYKKISVLILTVLCAGCGGNAKKQTLDPVEESDAEKFTATVKYETEVVMDTVIPNPGIRYNEVRKINSSAPPVKLNLAQRPEEKEFNLADYYSKVKYVKLKHPFAEQKKGFLGNAQCEISYEERGGTFISGMNSDIYFTAGNMIAGDFIFGYHCYDREGNFIYTIAVMEELPEYGNKISMQETSETKMIHNFSVFDDNCMILTVQGRKARLDLHNVTSKKTYLSRPYRGGRAMFINPESYISYQYNVLAREPAPFMYSFEIKGDTLCRFMNYNSLVESVQRAYPNPDRGKFYYYNNILTIRQAYNDTIYRMTSPNELTAAYVFDFGERKADVNTALFGDKSDKLIPNGWIETDKFAVIIHTENYDCPANRNNHSVKFFYSYYDKNENKLYRIPFDNFPDDFILSNEIDESLPILFNEMQVYGKNLYTRYTKAHLEMMLKHKSFSSLPVAQQEKTRSMYEDMDESEMLIMILE
ncbi:MAG: DUF4933 domain-containing protein [Tannerella sp.]|jgi:hypothetical protein|nr:DUF4933 domain-containing protein [Tannerella sp.]